MPEDWEGHPLRKDYALTEEPAPVEMPTFEEEPVTDAAALPSPDTVAGATDTFGAPGPVPPALEEAPSGTAVPEHAATSDTTFGQGQFDFGVEPVRRSAA